MRALCTVTLRQMQDARSRRLHPSVARSRREVARHVARSSPSAASLSFAPSHAVFLWESILTIKPTRPQYTASMYSGAEPTYATGSDRPQLYNRPHPLRHPGPSRRIFLDSTRRRKSEMRENSFY
jgi:hypothetical protein